ncbi:hypothetical protein ACSNO4_14975 [Kocuria flava]|uniref:hypothetical protein n=1 Tax=Kocuria flava TaxID=446860 RepID=UPI003F1B0019
MGSPKISVVAVIDLDGKHVRLLVTGELTVDTQTALHPLIRRAQALTPLTRVVVDLTDTRIPEAEAVEALVRHTRAAHTGHPSRQVRVILPGPMTPADAQDLQQLRAEQHSWTTGDPVAHSPVPTISTTPAQPAATPVTATVRHRHPRAAPPRRTRTERDHATAATPQPAASTQHTTTAAAITGTVLPFRALPRRRLSSAQRLAPPGRKTARPDRGA